jgi:hypothetical protein
VKVERALGSLEFLYSSHVKHWIAFVALFSAACSSSGGVWRQVETPHFVLRTDLGSSQARESGVALETTRRALIAAAWPTFAFTQEKIEVYVLANGVEFERYFGRRALSLSFRGPPRKIFIYGRPNRWELRTSALVNSPTGLTHEMAHQLSLEVWSAQPPWFYEGWADFLAATYDDAEKGGVVLGGVNRYCHEAYRQVRTTGLEDAFSWTKPNGQMAEHEDAGLHGISWLFVHWLYNEHPDWLRRYTDELSHNTPPERALQIAVPNLDLATVNRELFAYSRVGEFTKTITPVPPSNIVESSFQESILGAPERESVRSELAEAARRFAGPVFRRESLHPQGDTN